MYVKWIYMLYLIIWSPDKHKYFIIYIKWKTTFYVSPLDWSPPPLQWYVHANSNYWSRNYNHSLWENVISNGMSMLIYRRECCKYGAAVVKKGICNGETYFTKNVYEMCVNNANLISGKRFGIFWFWFIRIFYTVYMLMFDTYRL